MSASVMNAPTLIIEDRSRSRTTAPVSSPGTKAPYRSPRLERSRSRPRFTIDAPTRSFAITISEVVAVRKSRAEEQGLGTSPGGTREGDGVELLVDVPVWSNGCFSDLSTLHSLRDATLSHVHGLISHLMDAHLIQAKYRLLASRPTQLGWGSIRLAPSPLDRPSTVRRGHSTRPWPSSPRATVHNFPPGSERSLSFDEATYEADSDVEVEVVPGYVQEASDEEDDEPDSIVAGEVRERGYREGSVFTMTINGLQSLVLI